MMESLTQVPGLSPVSVGARLGSLPAVSDAQLLPQLEAESELRKMLTDEKMRSEQHKLNYQRLKVEHSKLQDEYASAQADLRRATDQNRTLRDSTDAATARLNEELRAVRAECDRLRDALGSQRDSAAAEQCDEQLGWRDKWLQLESESARAREQHAKLQYEHAFLRSEYEHECRAASAAAAEQRARHEAEVENLRRDRDSALAARRTHDSAETPDAQRLRAAQRDNAQLTLKVKTLLDELEEVRAERERSGAQADNVARLQTRQLAERAAGVKTLSGERDSLRAQLDAVQRELSLERAAHADLAARMRELEAQASAARSAADEAAQRARLDVAEARLVAARERGEVERERERAVASAEQSQAALEASEAVTAALEARLAEAEREVARVVQEARQEEWNKLNKVENEKMDLESKLQEAARRRLDDETRSTAAVQRADEARQAAEEARQTAERDAAAARAKLQQQENGTRQLHDERAENARLLQRVQRAETERDAAAARHQELHDAAARHKRDAGELRAQLASTRTRAESDQARAERAATEERATAAAECAALQRRCDDVTERLARAEQSAGDKAASHAKRKRKYLRLIAKLRQKMTLQAAKLEELELTRQQLQRCVPQESHQLLRKQLRELTSRQREFRTLLLTSDWTGVSAADALTASVVSGAGGLMAPTVATGGAARDKRQLLEIERLKRRLDELDDNRRAQLHELRSVSPIGGHGQMKVKEVMIKELDTTPPPPPPATTECKDCEHEKKQVNFEKDSDSCRSTPRTADTPTNGLESDLEDLRI